MLRPQVEMMIIMSLLLILMLVVNVKAQSTLLDSQCDNECFLQSSVEIQRLAAMMERNNEQSEKRIMELESKLINKNNELESKLQNETDTIKQLQAEISELKSKSQTSNVDVSMNYDCEDLRARGYLYSGVYEVNVTNVKTSRVYCEMTSDGKAWTRILHRQDNLVEFVFKKWADYEAGFGDPQGSHWMGLVQMHQLTTSRDYKLRVDLEDWEGEARFAVYSVFGVGPGSDKYRLTIDKYNGTAGDSMWYNDNMQFTTIDQDNDRGSGYSCAVGTDYRTGGWWYDGLVSCFYARLTGPYVEGGDLVPAGYGIKWAGWRGAAYSYKVATMKIQRL